MIFQLVLLLKVTSVFSDDNFYTWPEVFRGSDGLLRMATICFDDEKCNFASTYCGDEAVAMGILTTGNFTTEDGNYTLAISTISESSCPATATEITFNLDHTQVRKKFKRSMSLTSEPIFETQTYTDLCPKSNNFGYWLVPCYEPDNPLCEVASICEGQLLNRRPSSYVKEQSGKVTSTEGNKKCKFIFVEHIMYHCTKNSESLQQKETNFHGKVCTVHKGEVKEGKLIVEVPTTKGMYVCLTYRHGLNKLTEQTCTIAHGSLTEFSIPKKVGSLSLTCDGLREALYKKNSVDINCPMIFLGTDFSKLVCKDSYRPVVFWVSICWLMIGLPAIWSILIFYYKFKCWMYMRKFNRGVACEFCRERILTKLDEINHNNCPSHFCPYCKKQQFSSRDLLNHVRHCEKKEAIQDQTREILSWELNGFKCKYDVSTIHRTRKFKIVWFILFALIFLSSFTPSVANSCRHFRHCMSKERLSVDNRHVGSKDQPEFDEVERNHNFGNGDGSQKDTEAMVRSILIGLKAVEDEIMQRIHTLESKIEGKLYSELMMMSSKVERTLSINIEAMGDQLRDAIRDKFAEDMCEPLFRTMNMNVYLPENQQEHEFSNLRVHKDYEFHFHQFGQMIQSNILSKTDSKGIVAGQDSLIQIGRDSLHAQGGSGGANKFGLGGSSNLDVNAERQFTPQMHEDSMNIRREQAIQLPPPPRDSVYDYTRLLSETGLVRNKRETNENMAEMRINVEQHKLKQMKKITDYKNAIKNPAPFEIITHKDLDKTIKGVDHKITVSQMSHKAPTGRKHASKKSHDKWFDFHDTGTKVCEVTCLHEPNTCKCTKLSAPSSGKYELPWTSLQTDDIHFTNNPMSFKFAETTTESSDNDNIFVKTTIHAVMDLHEGSHVTWRLKNKDGSIEPTVSVVIPRVTQVYKSSFLYYTCERSISTEVKGLCTGGCGDYCGGRVCIGSRIWKWGNCRKVTCNPSWCWATNTGCCCCGSNVECPSNRKIGSVWEMEYMRTEFLICLFYNDRFQNCHLVDSTQTIEFGAFNLGITKVEAVDKKLSKHIFAVHEPISNTDKSNKATMWGPPTKIYLEPPICTGGAQCNHGFIGDVQIEDIECLPKLGKFCKEHANELHATNCTDKVFVSHSNTDMHMTCHSFNHHSCEHENVVKEMSFDEHLKQSEELEDHFYIKKLLMNFKHRSMLLYPLPRGAAGTVSLIIEGQGILIPKKDKKPVLENIMVNECSGCYLCKKGFTCTMTVDLVSPENTIVTVYSETSLIDFNISPTDLKKGNNIVTIWGVSYGEVKTLKACIKFGPDCIKRFAASVQLELPDGQFIPNFNVITGEGSDGKNDCSGLGWFSCAWNSFRKFFSDIWENIMLYVYVIVILVVMCLFFFFLPEIISACQAVYRVMSKKNKRQKGFSVKGKHVSDVYRDLSEKKKKYENKKKTDADDLEMEELLIQKDDLDFTSA